MKSINPKKLKLELEGRGYNPKEFSIHLIDYIESLETRVLLLKEQIYKLEQKIDKPIIEKAKSLLPWK